MTVRTPGTGRGLDSPDKVSPVVFLGMALCALLPLAQSSLQGYFFQGDNYALMFILENFSDNTHVWRHGYMTGLAGLADYFQTWPELGFYWLLAQIGVPASVSSRMGYFAILFLLQLGFFKVFCLAFADIVKDKKVLDFGGFVGAVFVVFNPYTFNSLVGGQPEYLRALAAFLFFGHAAYKLFGVGSRKPVLYIVVCVLSSTLFLGTNYFLSAFYIVACLVIGAIVLLKCKEQRSLLFLLVGLIVLVNLWWAIPFVLINLNSQVIATGMQQIDPDKALQGSSAMNFFPNLRIHYGRLGQMYPAQPHLNASFQGLASQVMGFGLLLCSLSCVFLYRIKRVFYLVVAAAVLLFLQMGGAVVSFALLWETLPFFKIFRQPYKFTMVLFLLQGAMLGLFGAWLYSRATGNIAKYASAVALCAIVMLNMWPMLGGNLGGILTPLDIPDDYKALKEKIDLSPERYRILALPQTRGVLKYTWASQSTGVSFLDRFFAHPILETKIKTIFNNHSQRLLEDNLEEVNAIASWRAMGVKYVVDRQDISRDRRKISQKPFPASQNVLDDSALNRIMESSNLHVYELDDFYPQVFSPETMIIKFKPEPLPGDDSRGWLAPKLTFGAQERELVESGHHASIWTARGASWVGEVCEEAGKKNGERDFLGMPSWSLRLNSVPEISFQRCSPTRYLIRVRGAKAGFPLVFNESFDKGWKLYSLPVQDGVGQAGNRQQAGSTQIDDLLQPGAFSSLGATPLYTASHSLANGFANMWWVDPAGLGDGGEFLLMIEYDVQPWASLALLISGACMALLLLWLLIKTVSRKTARGVVTGIMAVMLFPSLSFAATPPAKDVYFVNENGRVSNVFYGNDSQFFNVESDTTVRLRAIARAEYTYEAVRQKPLPMEWETQLCEMPPCSKPISFDFSDDPVELDVPKSIVISGTKANKSGRMGILCRATVFDTAMPDEGEREISVFTSLSAGRPLKRFIAEDFNIVPKDILYLVKRELGIAGDERWRWGVDGERMVLQTRVSVPLADETVMKLVVKEQYLPEAIQFSVGKQGAGGRQAFVFDSQVKKKIKRMGSGLVEVTVGFDGVLQRLGLDPETTFILEPLLFFPMDEKRFASVDPIEELVFQEISPLVSLNQGKEQDVEVEVHLDQLEELLPPTIQVLQLDLDVKLYDYDQFDVSAISLRTIDEDYRPAVFQLGDEAFAEWSIGTGKTIHGAAFRPAAFPSMGDSEFVVSPFSDGEVAVKGDAPYQLVKGGSTLSLSGFFPDADDRLRIILRPQQTGRLIRLSLKDASVQKLTIGEKADGGVFSSAGVLLPAGRQLELVIAPSSDNRAQKWSLSLKASSSFSFASAPPIHYAKASGIPEDGTYIFSQRAGTVFSGQLKLKEPGGRSVSRFVDTFSATDLDRSDGSVEGFRLDSFGEGSGFDLDPRRLPLLMYVTQPKSGAFKEYEWWTMHDEVQMVPQQGGINNGRVVVTPSMGIENVVLRPQSAFLYADALILTDPLPKGCSLTLIRGEQRIPLLYNGKKGRIDISHFALTDDLAIEISGLSTQRLQVLPNISLKVFAKRNSIIDEARCHVYVDGYKVEMKPERIEGRTVYLESESLALASGTHSFKPVDCMSFSMESLSVESDGAWSIAEDEPKGWSAKGGFFLLLLAGLGICYYVSRRIGLVNSGVGQAWGAISTRYMGMSYSGRLVFWGSVFLPALGVVFVQSDPGLPSVIVGALPVLGVLLVLDDLFASKIRSLEQRPLQSIWGNGALRLLLLAIFLILPIALLQLGKAYRTVEVLMVVFHALLLVGVLRVRAGALDSGDGR